MSHIHLFCRWIAKAKKLTSGLSVESVSHPTQAKQVPFFKAGPKCFPQDATARPSAAPCRPARLSTDGTATLASAPQQPEKHRDVLNKHTACLMGHETENGAKGSSFLPRYCFTQFFSASLNFLKTHFCI